MHFHSVNYCVMNDVMCIRSTYRYVHKKQTMHPSTQTTLITLVALLLHSSRLTSAFTSISSNRQSSFIFERSISSSSGSKRNVISSESSALAEILAADSSEDVESLLRLPRHASNEKVNLLLEKCDEFLNEIHKEMDGATGNRCELEIDDLDYNNLECPNDFTSVAGERVFANYYVDMGKVDTVGFDFDYTLVTYTNELLEMIYEMALVRLVNDNSYPSEMMEILKFDGNFSIRGLAVDRENGWICQLCYTHKVAVAWEGRERVSKKKLIEAYRGKRRLVPDERKKRLKPLNDLFSMAECCLMADVVQYFKDQGIPFHATSVVKDVLSAIGSTHISGEFHKIVAENPERYFEPKPYLKDVLEAMKNANKKLIFVSNSPFWYVDAGMKYVVGENWRNDWDVVIVSAGKPIFYTDSSRPFREVSFQTGRVKFKKVSRFRIYIYNYLAEAYHNHCIKIDKLEKGEVYTEGCLNELIRCVDWDIRKKGSDEIETFGSNVLYIGDSLFADLVDAKRQYGWTTAVVSFK